MTAWYMSIRIGSTDLDMLVDTGAQVSLLSKRVYDDIPGVSGSPLYPVDGQIAAANGGLINVYGRLELTLIIGRVPYSCEFLVADMGQLSGWLGMVFLKKNNATLMCSMRSLRLGGWVGLRSFAGRAQQDRVVERLSVSPFVSQPSQLSEIFVYLKVN